MRDCEIKIESLIRTSKKRRAGMLNMNRLGMDRRSGDDRRKSYRLGYFMRGGVERRSGKERRLQGERRLGWVRATKWSSVPGMVTSTAQGDMMDRYAV
jgi:hypothetical protein